MPPKKTPTKCPGVVITLKVLKYHGLYNITIRAEDKPFSILSHYVIEHSLDQLQNSLKFMFQSTTLEDNNAEGSYLRTTVNTGKVQYTTDTCMYKRNLVTAHNFVDKWTQLYKKTHETCIKVCS